MLRISRFSAMGPLSNFTSFGPQADGAGGVSTYEWSETRGTPTKASEITSRVLTDPARSPSPHTSTPAHDAAGNLTDDDTSSTDSQGFVYTWDAFGRLVKAEHKTDDERTVEYRFHARTSRTPNLNRVQCYAPR
jgi:YD repeat-containing protein